MWKYGADNVSSVHATSFKRMEDEHTESNPLPLTVLQLLAFSQAISNSTSRT